MFPKEFSDISPPTIVSALKKLKSLCQNISNYYFTKCVTEWLS